MKDNRINLRVDDDTYSKLNYLVEYLSMESNQNNYPLKVNITSVIKRAIDELYARVSGDQKDDAYMNMMRASLDTVLNSKLRIVVNEILESMKSDKGDLMDEFEKNYLMTRAFLQKTSIGSDETEFEKLINEKSFIDDVLEKKLLEKEK